MNSWISKPNLKPKASKKNQFFQTIKNLNQSLENFEALYLIKIQESKDRETLLLNPLNPKELAPPLEEKIKINLQKIEELQSKMEFLVNEILEINKKVT